MERHWQKNNNIVRKCLNSFNGFKAALKTEKAVSQEFTASLIIVAVAAVITRNFDKVFHIFLLSLIPMAFELINSTIEMLIDKTYGTAYNEDVRRMKDMLSASVLIGLVIGYGGAIWVLLR